MSYIITRLASSIFFYFGYAIILSSPIGILFRRFIFISICLSLLVLMAKHLFDETVNESTKHKCEQNGENDNPEKALRVQWLREETSHVELEIELLQTILKNDPHQASFRSPNSYAISTCSTGVSFSDEERETSEYSFSSSETPKPSLSKTDEELDQPEKRGKKRLHWERSLIFSRGKIVRVGSPGGIERKELIFKKVDMAARRP
jgi:hypothetical protein